MTTMLWALIAIQTAMAAFDTIYHHELTERLAWRPSQRHELALHAARNFVYVALFLVLGLLEPHGVFAMLVMLALAIEVVITLADFIEEDMSRKLPASERVNHTLLAINYGAILMLALPWSWGQRVLATAPTTPGPVIGLVQGNIPGEIKWSGDHQSEILARFLELSERAVAHVPPPTIVIWPETATGSYLRRQPDQAMRVAAFASRTRVPVFAGYADYAFDSTAKAHYYNAAGLFPPDGAPGPPYAKRHLVPFGERMPFQWLVPALGRIELGQAEWTPGTRPVLFPSAAGPFSCLVCFEAIFPDLVRTDVRHGARWLVNVTNDEWFGNSAALYQHAAMATFRAAECRVPLARCANTGLTLVCDAYGRVVAQAPVFESRVIVTALPAPGRPGAYVAFGDWPGLLSAMVVALGGLVALTGRVRRP